EESTPTHSPHPHFSRVPPPCRLAPPGQPRNLIQERIGPVSPMAPRTMKPRTTLTERETRRKDELLTREKASTADEIADAVVIKDDNLYFLSGADGQMPLAKGHGFGLYYRDCRYLH